MVTVNWIINAHKILVTPIVLAMMWYFHNWSAAAFLYLGCTARTPCFGLSSNPCSPTNALHSRSRYGSAC